MLNVNLSDQPSYIETVALHTPSVLSPSQSSNRPFIPRDKSDNKSDNKSSKSIMTHYQFLTTLYDDLAQRYFISDLPYTSDYIFDSLMQIRTAVLGQLFKLGLKAKQQQGQYAKLEEYMDQKERLVIEINKKKHHYHMKQELERTELHKDMLRSERRFEGLIEWLRESTAWYGQNTSDILGRYMIEVVKMMGIVQQKVISKQQSKEEKCRKELSEKINSQTKQLKQLRNANDNNRSMNNQNKQKMEQGKLTIKKKITEILLLRKQLQLARLDNQQQVSKLPTSQTAVRMKELSQTCQELELKKNENEGKIMEVKYYKEFNPEIDRLERKLQLIQLKIHKLQTGKSSVKSKSLMVTESDKMPTDHAINHTFRQDM